MDKKISLLLEQKRERSRQTVNLIKETAQEMFKKNEQVYLYALKKQVREKTESYCDEYLTELIQRTGDQLEASGKIKYEWEQGKAPWPKKLWVKK